MGENEIARDELFSYCDFKAGELLKSGATYYHSTLLFHVPVVSSDLGKSFNMEHKASDILGTDSEGVKLECIVEEHWRLQ
ncbi:hypothetical protein Bca4012_027483 [Brassica carinata]